MRTGRSSPAPRGIWKMSIVVRSVVVFLIAVGVGLPLHARAGAPPDGLSALTPGPATSRQQGRAIILFVGDGMGEGQRTAARWSAVGQDGLLVMDALPVSGWSRTASADSQVTDSAAAATAIATGVKTNNGLLALDPHGNPLTTILERAQARGMAVGLITTVQMGHATPAAFASHWPGRDPMTEIVGQMLAHRVDVMLGGGEDDFLPVGKRGCYSGTGHRDDGRNLIAEAVGVGYTYVCTSGALTAMNPISTTRLLGLFADGSMPRPFSPSLADMTQKAIAILARDPDGFFLMVEGGQIDWACHDHDAAEAISDTLGLDEAVAVAQAYASAHPGTLTIVSGDHETGGMTVSMAAGGDGPFLMPNGARFYVRWTTTDHTGADVPTTAYGQGASLLAGTSENTRIYDAMVRALDYWVWLPLVWRQLGEER